MVIKKQFFLCFSVQLTNITAIVIVYFVFYMLIMQNPLETLMYLFMPTLPH